MGATSRGSRDEVATVTSAPISRAEEQKGRQRRYLIAMSVRTLCFVGAIVVGDNWFRYVLVAGALILPYLAVVGANAVATRVPGTGLETPTRTAAELPSAG